MRKKGFTLIELLVVIAIIAILAAILFPVFSRARAKAQSTACLSNVKQLALATMMYATDHGDFLPWDRAGGWGGWPPYWHSWSWIYPIWRYVSPGGGSSGATADGGQMFECPGSINLDNGSWDPTAAPPANQCPGIPVRWSGYAPNDVLWMRKPVAIGGYWIAVGAQLDLIPNTSQVILLADWLGGGNISSEQEYCYWNCPYSGAAPGYNLTPNSTYYDSPTDNYPYSTYRPHNNGINLAFCDGHAKWSLVQGIFSQNWGLTPSGVQSYSVPLQASF